MDIKNIMGSKDPNKKKIKNVRVKTDKLDIKINPLLAIIAVVVIVAGILVVMLLKNVTPEHTKSFSDINGKWQLDSQYVDTVSQPVTNQTTVEISKSEMIFTVYTELVTPATVEGEEDTVTIIKKEYPCDISSAKSGKFTAKVEIAGELQADGTTSAASTEERDYTFNFDPGAKLVHLYYTNTDGKLVHEVLRVITSTEQEYQDTAITESEIAPVTPPTTEGETPTE